MIIELSDEDCLYIKAKVDGCPVEFKISKWGGSNNEGLYVLAYRADDKGRHSTIWEKEIKDQS